MRAQQRLKNAKKRISRLPFRHHAINDAYAEFLKDGTLPSDDCIAANVLHRAIHARKPPREREEWRLGLIASGKLRQPYGSTREMFFAEAMSEDKFIREFTRGLLESIVRADYDPTDHELIEFELEPDDFAPICLQLIGFPHDFVRPEYQAQWQRVQRQRNEVHDQRPVAEEWDRGARKAACAFVKHGEIPTDLRYYLHALTVGETFAITSHWCGKGGEELIAAYDALWNASDGERGAVLKRLCELQARWNEERQNART